MKKILLLLGYFVGIVIGSKYAQKKTKKTKKPETFGDMAREAREEIVSVHKRLLEDTKAEYWTAENKEFLFEKKEALLAYLDDFKKEALEKLEELKKSGTQLSESGQVELQRIYDQRLSYLEKASHLSKTALRSAQVKLDRVFQDVMKQTSTSKTAKRKTPTKKRKPKTLTKK